MNDASLQEDLNKILGTMDFAKPLASSEELLCNRERFMQANVCLAIINMSINSNEISQITSTLKKIRPEINIFYISYSGEEDQPIESIIASIHCYMLGFCPELSKLSVIKNYFTSICDDLHKISDTYKKNTNDLPILTPREKQILKLISEGKSNRSIARLLCRSHKTIETHRLNMMRKLDAHNAVELAGWCKRLGI